MPDKRFVASLAMNVNMCVLLQMYHAWTHLFHSGTNAATAESIFGKVNEVLRENEIPWANCVGASVDNTSVNLGKRNSIFTRAMEQNPAIYFMGCPCHIIHNTCMKAAETFNQVCVCHACRVCVSGLGG